MASQSLCPLALQLQTWMDQPLILHKVRGCLRLFFHSLETKSSLDPSRIRKLFRVFRRSPKASTSSGELEKKPSSSRRMYNLDGCISPAPASVYLRRCAGYEQHFLPSSKSSTIRAIHKIRTNLKPRAQRDSWPPLHFPTQFLGTYLVDWDSDQSESGSESGSLTIGTQPLPRMKARPARMVSTLFSDVRIPDGAETWPFK